VGDQALARAARRLQPTYAALVGGVQASPVVAPDETGWRVGGRRAWLWAFAGDGMTAYRSPAGRGFDDATAVLGADYAGVLERDGWAPYRRFTHAAHQSCLAHLLRRCDGLLGDAQRGQAKTPRGRLACPANPSIAVAPVDHRSGRNRDHKPANGHSTLDSYSSATSLARSRRRNVGVHRRRRGPRAPMGGRRGPASTVEVVGGEHGCGHFPACACWR
jgi:hypothetical protein